MIQILQTIVAIEGAIATVFCFGLFVFFVRARYQIGRAVGYDKLAEGILSGTTLIFTLVAQGVWDIHIPDLIVILMRMVMFSVSLACSIHLTHSVLIIMRKQDEMGQQ